MITEGWRSEPAWQQEQNHHPSGSASRTVHPSRTVSENFLLIPKTSGKYPEETDLDLSAVLVPFQNHRSVIDHQNIRKMLKGVNSFLAVSTSSAETIQFMFKRLTGGKLMQKTTVPPICGLKYYLLSPSIFSQWCCWCGQHVPSVPS